MLRRCTQRSTFLWPPLNFARSPAWPPRPKLRPPADGRQTLARVARSRQCLRPDVLSGCGFIGEPRWNSLLLSAKSCRASLRPAWQRAFKAVRHRRIQLAAQSDCGRAQQAVRPTGRCTGEDAHSVAAQRTARAPVVRPSPTNIVDVSLRASRAAIQDAHLRKARLRTRKSSARVAGPRITTPHSAQRRARGGRTRKMLKSFLQNSRRCCRFDRYVGATRDERLAARGLWSSNASAGAQQSVSSGKSTQRVRSAVS